MEVGLEIRCTSPKSRKTFTRRPVYMSKNRFLCYDIPSPQSMHRIVYIFMALLDGVESSQGVSHERAFLLQILSCSGFSLGFGASSSEF